MTGTPARVPGARRLYVRMPNWIGDVVMATPTIRALKAAYPEASITLGMRAWSAETLSGWDEVDATWVVPEGEANPFGGLFPYVRKLKEARFDVAILLTNSFGTALGPALAGIPTRVGYDGDLRGPLLSRRIPKRLRKTPQPTPALYARIAEAVGAPLRSPRYALPTTDDDRRLASAALASLGVDSKKPLMALNPGATFGSSKLWAPERFAAVGDALVSEFGAEVLVLVGPKERDLGRRVAAAARENLRSTHEAPVPLKPLRALMERISLLVTNDTGPRHFAVAKGVPVVCVMGPIHPAWTDWETDLQRIVRKDVPCGPCGLKTCPLDHRCMTEIGPDEVVFAAKSLAAEIAAAAARATKLSGA